MTYKLIHPTMKKLLLSITCLGTLPNLFAQPSLNQDDFLPQLDSLITQTIGPFADVGPAGADVTWDFSDLMESATYTAVYTDSDNTPHSDSFDGAIYALDNGVGTFVMFKSSASKLEVLGFDHILGAQVYDDPETYMDFPLNYMDSGTDDFSGSWNFGSATERSGTLEYEYDGYGTLIMPYGTVSDVIRVRQVETYEDVTSQGAFGFECICYVWLQAGTGRPILEIFEADNYGQISTGSQWNEPNATGIDYIPTTKAHVYPNPAKDQLTIAGMIGQVTNLRLYDVAGRQVKYETGTSLVQNGTLNLDVSGLNAGTYLLTFTDENGPKRGQVRIE